MQRPSDRFAEFLERRRLFFLVAAAAITAVAAVRAPTIETSADPTAYLPRSRPDVAFWLDLNARFGALDLLLVGLEEPSEPLTMAGLEQVREVTRRLEDLKAEGVLSARSLANVDTLTADESGTLHAERLIAALPETPEQAERLAARIRQDVQVPGALVSRDLRAYLVLVRVDARRDSRAVARRVEEVVERVPGPLRAFYFGGPFVANLVTRKVYDRLTWLIPLFAALLLLVLAVGVRRPLVIAAVLGCAGASLVWWLGFLRIAGFSLTAHDVNGLLLLLGVATLLYARAADAWLEGRVAAIGRLAVLASGIGLLLWLLDLLGPVLPASLPYLGRLGTLLAIGIAAILVLGLFGFWPILTFVRAVEVAVPVRFSRHRVLAILALLVVGVSASQARFLSSLGDLFLRSDDVGEALAFFDRRFGGSDFVQVSVRGDLRDPDAVARLHRFTDILQGNPEFSDVRSITQVLGFLAYHFAGRYRIPDDRESLNNLWFFLEGNEDIRALVSPGRDEAMLALRVPARSRPSAWTAQVQEAFRVSADTGREGTIARLEALRRAFAVDTPEGRTEEVLAGLSPDASRVPQDSALVALRRELDAPESPFVPTDEEWESLLRALRNDLGANQGRLEDTIRSLPTFQALQASADTAGRIAEMLRTRARALDIEVRSREAAARWLQGVPDDRRATPLIVRAEGVFADYLAGPRREGRLEITVTGYPIVAAGVSRDLRAGLWRSLAGVLLAVLLAGWAASGRRFPSVRFVYASLFATLLPVAAAWASGLQVDPGSATIYLLGPIAGGLIGSGAAAERNRQARWFALALAAASASLFVTGALPVIRIGAAVAGVFFGAWLSAYLSGAFEPDPAGRAAARGTTAS